MSDVTPMDVLRRHHGLETRREELERELQAKRTGLAEDTAAQKKTRAELDELEATVKLLRMKMDQRQVELQQAETEKERYEKQLLALSGDAYATMEHQIQTKTEAIGDLETRVLEGLEIIENAQEQIEAKEAAYTKRVEDLKHATERLEAFQKEAAAETADLEKQRAALEEQLDATTRGMVAAQRKRHGRATARIDGATCGGCHVGISPQLVAQAEAGKIVQCSHCQRILLPR